MEDEHSGDDLVIEASLTRILPPALTLEHGLVALKDALHEFKLNPPSSTSGFIRFQVLIYFNTYFRACNMLSPFLMLSTLRPNVHKDQVEEGDIKEEKWLASHKSQVYQSK